MLCCTTLLGGITFSEVRAATPAAAGITLDASRQVSFTVVLPLRNRDKLEALLADQQDSASPSYHKWLTPQEFGLRFGPSSESMDRVGVAMQARGFATTPHTRSLDVSGTAAQIERAFGTSMRGVRGANGVHATAVTPIHAPAELTAEGATVLGLSPLDHHVMAHSTGRLSDGVDNRFGPDGAYYYPDLKQAYVYPSPAAKITVGTKTRPFDGTGATIGTVISSDVLDSDLQLIFDHEHYSTTTGQPAPTLFARRKVNGGAPFSRTATPASRRRSTCRRR